MGFAIGSFDSKSSSLVVVSRLGELVFIAVCSIVLGEFVSGHVYQYECLVLGCVSYVLEKLDPAAVSVACMYE